MIRLVGDSGLTKWESNVFSHPEQSSGSVVYQFNHNMGKAPVDNKLFTFNGVSNGVWSKEDSGRDWAFNGSFLYRYSYFDVSANTAQFTIFRVASSSIDCKVQLFFE